MSTSPAGKPSRGLDTRKIAASRLWAASRFPYLASALFACRFIGVPGLGGLAVDEHWRIYADPATVDQLEVEEMGSLLVHHTGHLLRDHVARARALGIDKETAKRWTLAADAEINDDLSDELRLPGEPVTPEAFGLEPGRFAEEYFRLLDIEEEDCNCGSGGDSVPRGHDHPPDASSIPPGSAHLLRCQVASEILNACRGKEPGTVPAGLQRWAEELLEPKIDWRKVLAAEVRSGIASVAGRVDYTYQRPSRRHSISKDVVLPSLRRPVPEVAVVCDTSGSMSDVALATVLAEVEGLLRTVGVGRNRLAVLSVDAAVHAVQRVSTARQIELFGGGGTNMGEGLEAAARLRPRPHVVVVLTDGFTPWPETPPKGLHVVIGLIETQGAGWQTPSWARVVRIDEDFS